MINPISISVNFDSLNEAYGFPPGYRDPSFFDGFDRLATLAGKYEFPLSIFIIGKDLEHQDHAARVREWRQMGHEIGNHSWSHHFNIGALPPNEIDSEIERAHNAIAHASGVEPVGFICPAWATSRAVIRKLVGLGYEYDTSTFPSVLLYPMAARIAFNHRKHPRKALRMLHRKDWQTPLVAPLHPYIVGADGRNTDANEERSIVILPMPTANRFSICIWHTIGFELGWRTCFGGLKALLCEHPGFYYLIHPGDFLGPSDLYAGRVHHLSRMDVPLREKLARLDDAFSIMKESQRPMVTMRRAAAFHRDQLMKKGVSPAGTDIETEPDSSGRFRSAPRL